MRTIRDIYRIGAGPSSSHTMGPKRAAQEFKRDFPSAARFDVTLYGSLSATGRGHLTDVAIQAALSPIPSRIEFNPAFLPQHPNGMDFTALDSDGHIIGTKRAYSIGGGALTTDDATAAAQSVYPHRSMTDILAWCRTYGKTLWEYVFQHESGSIQDYLTDVWKTMKTAIERGLDAEGVLPGVLNLPRKAYTYRLKTKQCAGYLKHTTRIFALALATAEENASGGEVVTAPTCGSSGVLPSVIQYLEETEDVSLPRILRALATAGIIGNLAKTNASISGAEVGCQGEIGVACAMAAGAAAQLLGATPAQIEYAAEMGLEHHLGLTCDPVAGLVQVPCIERNAMAATRAMDCAAYALQSDGHHRISFDQVVDTMYRTGKDLRESYRETATGGLASIR
ncbi:MAG: L-serine ammonia-lyase [Planctomycetota bacterium]